MQSQTIFRKPIRLFLVLTSLLLSCSTGVSGESSELVAPKVTFQCQTPIDVGDGTVVKIAGDFNAWNPLDESYALTPIDARNHTITLDFEVSLVGSYRI